MKKNLLGFYIALNLKQLFKWDFCSNGLEINNLREANKFEVKLLWKSGMKKIHEQRKSGIDLVMAGSIKNRTDKNNRKLWLNNPIQHPGRLAKWESIHLVKLASTAPSLIQQLRQIFFALVVIKMHLFDSSKKSSYHLRKSNCSSKSLLWAKEHVAKTNLSHKRSSTDVWHHV